MRKLVLAFFLPVLCTLSYGQAAKNCTKLGQYTFSGQLANLYPYAAGGNEYAIVGEEDGVAIVNITNPASPSLVQYIPGVNTIWREIRTWSHYAYITNEGDDGLRIIDLNGLPGTCVFKDTVMNGLNTNHTVTIDENGYMYLNGGPFPDQGMEIYNLNPNPWRPTRVGEWHDYYIHDMYVRDDTAYIGAINDGLFQIVDLSNKTSPSLISSTSYANSFTHNTWLNDASTVCFTTDELDEAYIYSWDITDPTNPIMLDGIRSSLSGGLSIPHNVSVINDFLVTSYYKDGVHITDAARPHNLIEVGYYDTSPLTGGGFDGAWGAFPYLPSGNIIVSDMSEGLFIIGPTYVRGCYLEGIVTDSVTGVPIVGASIVVTGPGLTESSDAAGFYATGTADAGTYSVTYSKFGYKSKTISYALSSGVLTAGDVQLAPLPTLSYTINVVDAATLAPVPNAKVVAKETSSGFELNYTADAGGVVNDPAFLGGTYDFTAGKWGYVTKLVTATATSGSTSVTIALNKGYYDDYYLDFSWTTSGSATSGDWVRGEPDGTDDGGGYECNPDLDIPSDFGDQCYITGNDGGSAGNDDVDGGTVTLTSPAMDLTSYGKPVLKVYRWFANTGGFSTPNDTLAIRINNGLSTVVLKRVFGTTQNNWVQDTFDLESFITITSNMKASFVCGDYPSGHVTEGAVDLFRVVDAEATSVDIRSAYAPELTVYPNPLDGDSRIVWNIPDWNPGMRTEIQVTDITGRQVLSVATAGARGSVPVAFEGASGVYLATLVIDGTPAGSVRMVK